MQAPSPLKLQHLTYLQHLRQLQQLQQLNELTSIPFQGLVSPDVFGNTAPPPPPPPPAQIDESCFFNNEDLSTLDPPSELIVAYPIKRRVVADTSNLKPCTPFVSPTKPRWLTMKVEKLEAIEELKRSCRHKSILYQQIKSVNSALCHHADLSVLQDEHVKHFLTCIIQQFKTVSDILQDETHKMIKIDRIAFLCASPGCANTAYLPCPYDDNKDLSICILRCVRISGVELPLRCYDCWGC